MAYKFNLGTFNLAGTLDVAAASGDIELPNSSVDNADLAGSITDAKLSQITSTDKVAGSAVQLNASSGITNDSGLKLNLSGAASGLVVDPGGVKIGLSGSGGLGSDAGGLFVSLPSNSGLDLEAGGLKIEAGGVTNAMLEGSIANGKLANSSMTINGTERSLGDTFTTPNDDVSEANLLTRLAALDSTDTINIGDTGNDTTVNIRGNLTVQGTTTTVNSTDLAIADKIIQVAAGATNQATSKDSGLLFGQGNANGARFLYEVDGSDQQLVAKQGTGSGLIDIKADAFIGSGAQLTGVVANGVQHSLTNITASNTVSDPGMIIGNIASSATVTISGSFNQGDQILVKGNGNLSTTVVLTITGAAGSGFNFDGQESIELKSPRAGLTLIYDGDAPNSLWHIM